VSLNKNPILFIQVHLFVSPVPIEATYEANPWKNPSPQKREWLRKQQKEAFRQNSSFV
jgi:hypothetical protein